MKIISKALLVYGGFFVCWFLLAQVDFVSFFEILNTYTRFSAARSCPKTVFSEPLIMK